MPAKTLSTNPLVIGSGDTWTTVPAIEARVRIREIYWATGAAPAAGGTVIVAHADGSLIWQPFLTAGDLSDRELSACHIEAKGLAITPPTHGVLFIYLMDSYA